MSMEATATIKKTVEKIRSVASDLSCDASIEVTLVIPGLSRGEFLTLVRAEHLEHAVQVTIEFPQGEMTLTAPAGEQNGHYIQENGV